MEHGDLDLGFEDGPVGGGARGVLVVVKDGELGHDGLLS